MAEGRWPSRFDWPRHTIISDLRRHLRTPCVVQAYLFDEVGIAGSATILDCSKAGVRVLCAEAGFHLKALYLLRLDTGAAYALRRVWYAGELGGYEFTRRVDSARPTVDRALQAITAAWSEHHASREHP